MGKRAWNKAYAQRLASDGIEACDDYFYDGVITDPLAIKWYELAHPHRFDFAAMPFIIRKFEEAYYPEPFPIPQVIISEALTEHYGIEVVLMEIYSHIVALQSDYRRAVLVFDGKQGNSNRYRLRRNLLE